MYKSPYCRHLWYIQNHKPKKLSLFDIVGIYSIGTNFTLKVGLVPMETSHCTKTKNLSAKQVNGDYLSIENMAVLLLMLNNCIAELARSYIINFLFK